MLFGNQQITRADMPNFSWREADPFFLYGSFQDTLKKAKSAHLSVATPMIATQEQSSNEWEGK